MHKIKYTQESHILDLRLSPGSRDLSRSQNPLSSTPCEFSILSYLDKGKNAQNNKSLKLNSTATLAPTVASPRQEGHPVDGDGNGAVFIMEMVNVMRCAQTGRYSCRDRRAREGQ